MTLRLAVLLWEHPGRADDLATFEDAVLALVPDHGGHVVSRDTVVDRNAGDPLELQLIELPDHSAFTDYLTDPRRDELARTHDRDAIIARTQVMRVQVREPD